MIDPMVAISALTASAGAISSAIKAGKDVAGLGSAMQKYARAEAELNFGAQRKKNSFLSKFTGAEATAIDKYFKQQELNEAREKLRETFLLYTKNGHSQWVALNKMIAEERVEYRKELQRKAEFRDTLYTIFGVIFLGAVFVAGSLGIMFFAKYLKEQQTA